MSPTLSAAPKHRNAALPSCPEAVLLYRAAGAGQGAAGMDHQGDLWRRADSRRFLGLMMLENAATVVHDHFERFPDAAPAKPLQAQVAILSRVWTLKLTQLERRLGDVVRVLAEAGIEVTLLKGAALAVTVFRGFADRPMADIDVLVDEARAAEAVALLQRHGWTPVQLPIVANAWDAHHHLPPLADTSGSGLRLEIHVAPLEPGHPFDLDPARIARDAGEVVVHGTSVRVPEPHLHVAHAAAHFAWSHRFESGGFNAVRDLVALCNAGRIEWDRLVAVARETRTEHCCYWLLRLAHATAGLAVPDRVLDELSPAVGTRTLRMLHHHIVQVMFRSPIACPSVRLRKRLWAAALGESPVRRASAGVWSEHLATQDAQPGMGAAIDRLATHVRCVPRWSSYATSLLGSALQVRS